MAYSQGESEDLELEDLRQAEDGEVARDNGNPTNTVGQGRDFHFGNRTTVNINNAGIPHCPGTPQLIRENQRLKSELEAEQMKHETTKDTLTKITNHLMQELDTNKALEKRNKELLANVKSLQKQLSTLTKKTHMQQEQNREEIAKLKKEGEYLRQTVQSLKEQLEMERNEHIRKIEESQKMMMEQIQQNAARITQLTEETKRSLWQRIKDFFKKKKLQSTSGGTVCQPTDSKPGCIVVTVQ